jgi:micrococcal nuclease
MRTISTLISRAAALLVLATALAGGVSAHAGDRPRERLVGPVAASVLKVRDGDTLEVEAHVWPSQIVRTAVRLRGIDAPELKARCAAERDAAEAARERLRTLVAGGEVQLLDIAGDKYFGRVLAKVEAGSTRDVGATLLREGLVAPYEGGRRRDWCAGAPTLSGFRPFG